MERIRDETRTVSFAYGRDRACRLLPRQSTHASLPETVVGLRFFFGIVVGLEREDRYNQMIHPSSLVFPLTGAAWFGS